jgi:hypothetical protein
MAVATILCSFALPSGAATPGNNNRMIGAARIPFDSSTGFLNGYSLRVPRTGNFMWNSAPVGQAVLKTYLRQWAALPQSAGRLFVAFEPGTPQHRVEWVRKQIIDSGLCQQRRCAEVGWNVKRPVVNSRLGLSRASNQTGRFPPQVCH